MSDQLIIGGAVIDRPTKEWAALRCWAAARRDSLPAGHAGMPHLLSLISLLDSFDNLRHDYPLVAAELWKSALALAELLTPRVS